jgi:hypothetical protein
MEGEMISNYGDELRCRITPISYGITVTGAKNPKSLPLAM